MRVAQPVDRRVLQARALACPSEAVAEVMRRPRAPVVSEDEVAVALARQARPHDRGRRRVQLDAAHRLLRLALGLGDRVRAVGVAAQHAAHRHPHRSALAVVLDAGDVQRECLAQAPARADEERGEVGGILLAGGDEVDVDGLPLHQHEAFGGGLELLWQVHALAGVGVGAAAARVRGVVHDRVQ